MEDARAAERFDALAGQLHEWVESAVALDAGHFPNELLNELEDLTEELKALVEDEGGDYDRQDVNDLFLTPEMAEILERFPPVRRLMERAWGSELTELIEEEGGGFVPPDSEED